MTTTTMERPPLPSETTSQAPRTGPATSNSHEPSGRPPWPTILLDGDEGSGKTFAAAEFTGDSRVGRSFLLEIGAEACAEEYGSVPGARYRVLNHDGSWKQICARVDDVREEAEQAIAAGEPPVVLIVDTMSGEWKMLTDWASDRARRTPKNREILAKNPDAEITVSPNFWNDANARHTALMTKMMLIPGIVILTAQSKLVSQFDDNGKPMERAPKVVSLDAHKKLGYQVNAWVRLHVDGAPEIVKLRSTKRDMRPGKHDPQAVPQFNLGWLIFDVLGCDPGTAERKNVQPMSADAPAAGENGPSMWQQITAAVAELSVTNDDRRALYSALLDRALASPNEVDDAEQRMLLNEARNLSGDGMEAVVAQLVDAGRTLIAAAANTAQPDAA